MNWNYWKRKLLSRKWWMGVIGGVTGVVMVITHNGELVQMISGAALAGASIVAYILGEGFADAAHTNDQKKEDESDDDEDEQL